MKRVASIVALFVIAIIFIIIGHWYHEDVQVALKQPLVTVAGKTFDWWSLSHLLLYFIIGYITVDKHVMFIGIGVLWELLEDYLSSSRTTQLVDCNTASPEHVWCQGWQDDYWYLEQSDVIMNALGYFLGSALHIWTRSSQPLDRWISD